AQADAGAMAVQLFESWGGAIPEAALQRLSVAPLRRIIARVKAARPGLPVIVFPRGVGVRALAYARIGADAIGMETDLDPAWAAARLAPHAVLQGNLSPECLVAGGPALDAAVARILEACAGVPFVFNLGHGVVPHTPP